jgi:hypothetical protein
MSWYVDALKYGGPPVAILGLVFALTQLLIKKDNVSRGVFRLAAGVIVVLIAITIFLLVQQYIPSPRPSTNGPITPPTGMVPKPAGPKPGTPPQSSPSVLAVRGRVTPVPKPPAYILIEGVTGKWPIDTSGNFSFNIPGPQREAVVIVEYGDNQHRSGFYVLSGELLSISIK